MPVDAIACVLLCVLVVCIGAGEGLITYMRTDGTFMAPAAVSALRAVATEDFGPDQVPATPRCVVGHVCTHAHDPWDRTR